MIGSVAALVLGGRVALSRITGKTAFAIAGGAITFGALGAWAERLADNATAANHALCGPAFGIAIPLTSFAMVSVALRRVRPDNAIENVASLGANRRAAVVGSMLATAAIAAAICLMIASVTSLVANSSWNADSSNDVFTSAWIGALTGGAYVFFFVAASTVGKTGGGRVFALLADWILGPMVGAGAVVFPRSHALNLLGAEPVMALSQRASSAILAAMVVVFAAIAAARTRP